MVCVIPTISPESVLMKIAATLSRLSVALLLLAVVNSTAAEIDAPQSSTDTLVPEEQLNDAIKAAEASTQLEKATREKLIRLYKSTLEQQKKVLFRNDATTAFIHSGEQSPAKFKAIIEEIQRQDDIDVTALPPLPDDASAERILKTFRGIKGNNFNRNKAQALLDASRRTIYSGIAKDARAFNIRTNIEQVRLLQKQLDQTLEMMQNLFNSKEAKQEDQEVMEELIDNLRTIPGVADKTILALLAECGNLDRFYAPKALIGFLGLYPTLSQSGDSTRNGRLAKRGASLAKKAIYLASIAAIRHNDEMRTIYMNYRSKGRAKKEAIIIVARKLLTIIYTIYTRNIPYDPQRVFVAKPNQ